ncbi:DinB family protein [Ilumatobacter sp.]|uniref:DinB family protein n=1 Tax=Ilumatobacter sp. TaxID=1967498 RepID=UPI003B522C64
MSLPTIADLLDEYERALRHTDDLVADLTDAEVAWRPHPESSAIGWHLGHQAAVSHFTVRNLIAAEPPLDDELDRLMDSATAESERGDLPGRDRLLAYRSSAAERLRFHVTAIDEGRVGAPAQLRLVAAHLLVAVTNHEYQHDTWIGEVRRDAHGRELPPDPVSPLLSTLDGHLVVGA